MPNRRLLVIEDSLTIRAIIDQIFAGSKEVNVVGVLESGEQVIAEIDRLRPDVITLDIMLPGIDGFSVLKYVMEHHPTPVIVISSSGPIGSELCDKAISLGAYACLDKSKIISHSKDLQTAILKAKRGTVASGQVAHPS